MSVTNNIIQEGKVCVIQRILTTKIYPDGQVHQSLGVPRVFWMGPAVDALKASVKSKSKKETKKAG